MYYFCQSQNRLAASIRAEFLTSGDIDHSSIGVPEVGLRLQNPRQNDEFPLESAQFSRRHMVSAAPGIGLASERKNGCDNPGLDIGILVYYVLSQETDLSMHLAILAPRKSVLHAHVRGTSKSKGPYKANPIL